MRTQNSTIDFDRIAEQISELLKQYGLSFREFLNHMKLDTQTESEDRDCCPEVSTRACCPEDHQVFDNINEFDWEA
ncbi:MAG: hypothetical protein ACFFD6_07075 [Candidatus Thorarchaeota archaeon]